MSKICVVGTGYVGLVTGACFADLGHQVTCVDVDQEKVDALNRGLLPFYEPGLEPLVLTNMEYGRLQATTSFSEAVNETDFVFMCVGTPVIPGEGVDLQYLHQAYLNTCSALSFSRPIFVNKSTVPPGTADSMRGLVSRFLNGRGPVEVVSNPEFLREGHAVSDFQHPNRIVIGARDDLAAQSVEQLYDGLEGPRMITDPVTAELVKYASNAFLATKISFINEIAMLCEKLDIDVGKVARGMGLDQRIGPDFLRAGIGYGGSCLPKDTAALIHFLDTYCGGSKLLQATTEINTQQPFRLVNRVKDSLTTLQGAKVAVLGLTFKSDTDDIRCSPAIEIVKGLLEQGAEVKGCDPLAWREASTLHPTGIFTSDPYQTADGCDAVILATDWPEFKALDLRRLRKIMRGNLLADGRNVFDPTAVKEAGFRYLSVGRCDPPGSKSDAMTPAVVGTRRYE